MLASTIEAAQAEQNSVDSQPQESNANCNACIKAPPPNEPHDLAGPFLQAKLTSANRGAARTDMRGKTEATTKWFFITGFTANKDTQHDNNQCKFVASAKLIICCQEPISFSC